MNADNLNKMAHIMNVPIQNLSARDKARIEKAPQAQLRTASYKKSVYIVNNLVFKGPYSLRESQLMNNLRYNYAIQLMEEALNLPEWQRGSLPWDCIACWEDDQYYLVSPNVGRTKDIPSKIRSSKIETNVKVVKEGGCVLLVSEIEKTVLLTGNIKIASLQHLYFRFLLGIGDSGTHNILIRTDYDRTGRLIAGIDLEERRGNKVKSCRLDHLFKTEKAAKYKEILYQSYIPKIISLSYGELSPHILDGLDAVGIQLGRLKENMELWNRLR